MLRQSQFLSVPHRNAVHKPKGATDFLQSNDGLAALLPAVARMAALQKDCAALLPAMFDACDVLQYDADQLVLSTPNAALAAKLKQQVPKLQAHLVKSGWQVNVIRIKVQVAKPRARDVFTKQIHLPQQALSALDQLGKTLENSPRNQALIDAVRAMVARHKSK
ncbi:hypothetical protein D9O50_07575 [Oxalobacteraceae bacterium CAVE-383]|nr:hypothetical protein D9O50_07575 [Oxalobacteraceae bacterium CAVE-383]